METVRDDVSKSNDAGVFTDVGHERFVQIRKFRESDTNNFELALYRCAQHCITFVIRKLFSGSKLSQ